MCLYYLTDDYVPESGEAYKIFKEYTNVDGSKLLHGWYNPWLRKPNINLPILRYLCRTNDSYYEYNKWYIDIEIYMLQAEEQRIQYRTGFHMFKNKTDIHAGESNNYVLRKVKYDNLVCTGYQYGEECLVARKMLILPEDV